MAFTTWRASVREGEGGGGGAGKLDMCKLFILHRKAIEWRQKMDEEGEKQLENPQPLSEA